MTRNAARSAAKKAARPGKAAAKKDGKVFATKASASVIRESLGIRSADVRVGLAALRLARAPVARRAKSPQRSSASSPGGASKTAAR